MRPPMSEQEWRRKMWASEHTEEVIRSLERDLQRTQARVQDLEAQMDAVTTTREACIAMLRTEAYCTTCCKRVQEVQRVQGFNMSQMYRLSCGCRKVVADIVLEIIRVPGLAHESPGYQAKVFGFVSTCEVSSLFSAQVTVVAGTFVAWRSPNKLEHWQAPEFVVEGTKLVPAKEVQRGWTP